MKEHCFSCGRDYVRTPEMGVERSYNNARILCPFCGDPVDGDPIGDFKKLMKKLFDPDAKEIVRNMSVEDFIMLLPSLVKLHEKMSDIESRIADHEDRLQRVEIKLGIRKLRRIPPDVYAKLKQIWKRDELIVLQFPVTSDHDGHPCWDVSLLNDFIRKELNKEGLLRHEGMDDDE